MYKNNIVPLPTLEDHLAECENRYQGLAAKLDTLENKLNRMETLLLEIKNSLISGVVKPQNVVHKRW
jgi:predicted  nucleic acid-binding Zn-ribbon protein